MAVPAEKLLAGKRRYTVAEYLATEERAVDRHEFHDGEILAMSGGTYEHSRIVANVIRSLGNRLDGSPCHVVDSNLRVSVDRGRRYLYPDASVICGPPVFDSGDVKRTTILNPKVVVEVLSESTEAYDRGRKFAYYREVEMLREYILVSQGEAMVETIRRSEDGGWTFATHRGTDATAEIRSVGVVVPLREIYDGIELPTGTSAGAEVVRPEDDASR